MGPASFSLGITTEKTAYKGCAEQKRGVEEATFS